MAMKYCPVTLLGSFTLLMAGHGHCVSTAMMLGDRGYAMRHLDLARTLGDEELALLADRLNDYFEEVLA